MYKKIIFIISGILLLIFTTHAAFSIDDSITTHEELSPLTVTELRKVVAIVKKSPQYSKELLFSMVTLDPPEKSTITSPTLSRRAFLILFNPKKNELYEVFVDVLAHHIISWKEIPDAQPIGGTNDYELPPKLLKKNIAWLQSLEKRGINNANDVYADTWLSNASDDSALKGHRIMRVIPFYLNKSKYMFGRPIEGLSALVDLTTQKVIVIDTDTVPIPQHDSAYDSKSVGPLREAPNFVQLKQEGGPSFKFNGHQITWQNWRFNISFTPRDGLVLHKITYHDRGRWRSILEQVSLADIAVPYGDPDPQWNWRHAWDASEYGIGLSSTPLKKNVEVPENAVLLNSSNVDQQGNIIKSPNAIGIYEQYDGFAWRHYDLNTQSNATRRAQNLVITSALSVSNYDYVVKYIFKQDASIEVVVSLTGILLPKGVDKTYHERYGHLVAKNVAAPHHQHFFNFRLDFDVDGIHNWLREENTGAAEKNAQNPTGNAFMHTKTLLKNTLEARRMVNPTSSRFWVVFNPNETNALGQSVGYGLIPGNNTVPYAQPDSTLRQKAGFINYHLWATPYDPKQMNAMGLYPVLTYKPDGLPVWAQKNNSLENADLVVWYTMGTTHIPRPEEWPVMPRTDISFKIIPISFFSRNPAINLPDL